MQRHKVTKGMACLGNDSTFRGSYMGEHFGQSEPVVLEELVESLL